MATYSICPGSFGAAYQALTSQGIIIPNAGGSIQALVAGSNTPTPIYQDANGTAHTNPIVLDATGRIPGTTTGELWFDNAIAGYKLIVKDAAGNTLGTYDNLYAPGSQLGITGINGVPATGPWQASLTTSGYQKFPSGLILQWGVTAGMLSNTSLVINYPISFPTGALVAYATPIGTAVAATPISAAVALTSPGTLTVYNWSSGAATFNWLAIGR